MPPDTSDLPLHTDFPPWDPRSDPTFEPPKPPEPRASSELPSLTCDVHPLMAREKFPANVDYDWVFLEPAKLASQILSTRQAIHYLLALFTNCKHKSVCEGRLSEGHPYRSSVAINDIQDHDRQFVQHWLRKIADAITWKVGGYLDIDINDDEPTLAWTLPLFEEDAEPASAFHLGHSTIHISGELYCDLLMSKNSSADDILAKRLTMTNILLHELSHALHFAVTERAMDDEDLFNDSNTTEAGYDFVRHLFGDLPDQTNDLIMEWSDLAAANPGRRHKAQIQGEYVHSLFTNHFWDETTLCGGEVGLTAWELQDAARKGLPKPRTVPRSIWDLLASYERAENCLHQHELSPDILSSFQRRTTKTCASPTYKPVATKEKEPKVITSLPKFRGVVPFIPPAVLSSIRSMSDYDLTGLIIGTDRWHVVGDKLERRISCASSEILSLRLEDRLKIVEE